MKERLGHDKSMIPKLIHYFWFGFSPKPEIVVKCIESWKKFLPDFKIIEWNESNYDINKCMYMAEAYKSKKWAFVTDYARFDILYKYGGIYFDTDVEIIRTFPGEYFEKTAFTGVESNNYISPGLVLASEKGNEFLRQVLDIYNKEHFIVNGKENLKTVNIFTTELLQEKGFVLDGTYQEIDGVCIYPSEYFCGFNLDIHEPEITDKTICIHHYAATWKKNTIKKKIQKIIKKYLGINFYKHLIKLKRLAIKKGKNS